MSNVNKNDTVCCYVVGNEQLPSTIQICSRIGQVQAILAANPSYHFVACKSHTQALKLRTQGWSTQKKKKNNNKKQKTSHNAPLLAGDDDFEGESTSVVCRQQLFRGIASYDESATIQSTSHQHVVINLLDNRCVCVNLKSLAFHLIDCTKILQISPGCWFSCLQYGIVNMLELAHKNQPQIDLRAPKITIHICMSSEYQSEFEHQTRLLKQWCHTMISSTSYDDEDEDDRKVSDNTHAAVSSLPATLTVAYVQRLRLEAASSHYILCYKWLSRSHPLIKCSHTFLLKSLSAATHRVL